MNIPAACAVVSKSRGHSGGGCDEFFRHDQVIEVYAPGLTKRIIARDGPAGCRRSTTQPVGRRHEPV